MARVHNEHSSYVCSWYLVSDPGGLHKCAEQQVTIPPIHKSYLENLHGCGSGDSSSDRLLKSYGML